MTVPGKFEVIIIGGSYSGLAAGMALGRGLKKVLIIDGGNPCNKQTPHSHNFLTGDGESPAKINALAKQQVEKYRTVTFLDGLVTGATSTHDGFQINVASGETFIGGKLIFATGIHDILPDIEGFAACWGISVLHCPYCHGYEISNQKTGIIHNGEPGFEFCRLISNWTNDLILFTNGTSTLTTLQAEKLAMHRIQITESKIERLEHTGGHLKNIHFDDGTNYFLKALYAPCLFEQPCNIPVSLGCRLTTEGYIETDNTFRTTVDGIFCCGDNVSRIRTIANAVAMGTTTGMMVNKELIIQNF